MTDPRYWIWLSLAFTQGSSVCDNLLHYFCYDPKNIYKANRAELVKFAGERSADCLLNTKNFDRANKIYEFCQKENIGVLTPDSKFYPSPLLRITGYPTVIYYKGRLPDFTARPTIGVVGTRSVTPYGRSAAYTISHDLASAGAIVVSGMALGTDTAAHRGALDAKGTTVAFLGCGIDTVYPRENEPLMREIEQNGAVMTDYPPGERPEGWHFPVRNRLISGVSHGVLIVEAAMKSGALITADHASKQGKLIYAVPGKVGELASTGTNNLIRNGAKMVTSSADILTDFKGLFGDTFNACYPKTNRNNFTPARPRANYIVRSKAPNPSLDPDNKPYPMPIPEFNPLKNTELEYPVAVGADGAIKVTITAEDIEKYSPKPNPYAPVKKSEPKPEPDPTPKELEDVAVNTLYCHMNNAKTMRNNNVLKNITEHAREDQLMSEQVESEVKSFAESYEEQLRVFFGKKDEQKKQPNTDGMNETEEKIVKLIFEKGKLSVDGMSSLGLPVSKLLATLTALEIKGVVEQLPGGYFILK